MGGIGSGHFSSLGKEMSYQFFFLSPEGNVICVQRRVICTNDADCFSFLVRAISSIDLDLQSLLEGKVVLVISLVFKFNSIVRSPRAETATRSL